MINKLFEYKYDNKLILELIENTKFGTLASNIFAPIIVSIVLYNFVPLYYLVIFCIFHITIFIFRLLIAKRFQHILIQKYTSTVKCLQKYTILISLSALSFCVMFFYAEQSGTGDLELFFILSIIVALSAGSLATMGSVYIVFASFMVSNIVPLIIVVTLHGGQIFYFSAIVLIFYLFINLTHGFRLFKYHKKAIDLEKKFSTIYNNSSDGIAIIKDNHILEYNDTFSTMFKTDTNKHNLVGQKLLDIIPPKEYSNYHIEELHQNLDKAQNESISFEWLYEDKDKKPLYLEIKMSPMQLKDDLVIHAIFRDINKRKKAELEIIRLNETLEERVAIEVEKNRIKDKQLLQQNKLAQMGEMISMIAHQWRQPLSAISSVAITINLKAKMDKLDKQTTIDATNKIAQYTKHLSETIDDFRNFFKQNKDKHYTSYTELIISVLKIVEPSIINKDIKIIKKLNSTITFKTYINEVKQVLLNLIKNAEDALKERGVKEPKIFIESYDNTLIIRDNAGGIQADIIDKIFDPYFSTKEEKTGTGLGLYMSKTIIEEHCGGKLTAYNDKEGAVFKIEL